MFFRNYRLRNTCLCKCLKSYLSVHPGTVDILKRPKHCCNAHDSGFITFVHHSAKISAAKSLS